MPIPSVWPRTFAESTPSDALHDALEALEEARVRCYVFRAQADIAATVEIGVTDWQDLLAPPRRESLAPRVEDPESFPARPRLPPRVHEPTGVPVDPVLAGAVGHEQEFLDRARPVDLAGLRGPSVGREDLVAPQILAGRPRDLDGVRGILRDRAGQLDLERIRHLLPRLEAALERRDLLPEPARLSRSRRAIRRRRKILSSRPRESP